MTIRPLVDLLAVKKKQETKRSINEEIHTQVTRCSGRPTPALALCSLCFCHSTTVTGTAPKSVPKVRGAERGLSPVCVVQCPLQPRPPSACRAEPGCVGPSCPPKAHPGPTALILHALSALPMCQCGCQWRERVGKSPPSCSCLGPSLPVLGSPSDRDRGHLWSLRASPLEGQVSGEVWWLGKGFCHHPEGFTALCQVFPQALISTHRLPMGNYGPGLGASGAAGLHPLTTPPTAGLWQGGSCEWPVPAGSQDHPQWVPAGAGCCGDTLAREGFREAWPAPCWLSWTQH